MELEEAVVRVAAVVVDRVAEAATKVAHSDRVDSVFALNVAQVYPINEAPSVPRSNVQSVGTPW